MRNENADPFKIRVLLERALRDAEVWEGRLRSVALGLKPEWASDIYPESNHWHLDSPHGAVVLSDNGAEAAEVLSAYLSKQRSVQGRATLEEIRAEVGRILAKIRTGQLGLPLAVEELAHSLAPRLGRAIVVHAVGGIHYGDDGLPSPKPLRLSDRIVIGSINEDFEKAVSKLAVNHGLDGVQFKFEDKIWWSQIPDEPSQDLPMVAYYHRNPVVIAVAVDATGATANFHARQIVEALLGAIWLPDFQNKGWLEIDHPPQLPPWILGDLVGTEAIDGMSLETLQVSSARSGVELSGHRIDYGESIVRDRANSDIIELAAASLDRNGPKRGIAQRVATACRHALLAARQPDPQLMLLHSVIGLEALLGDRRAAEGASRRFARRLRSLMALGGWSNIDSMEFGNLYDERSQIAHEGLTSSTYAEADARARAALHNCCTCIRDVVLLMSRQNLRSEEELLGFIDAAAVSL